MSPPSVARIPKLYIPKVVMPSISVAKGIVTLSFLSILLVGEKKKVPSCWYILQF